MVYGMRLNPNCQIRENGRKRDIFDKVQEVRQRITMDLPNLNGDRLIHILSHCRRYYEGNLYYGRRGNSDNLRRIRDLSKDERIVYELILQMKLNPSTLYRWFLATRVPADIKEKLSKGLIGQKKALEISANRRRVRESNVGLLMIEEIRTIMGGL